MNVQLYVYDLSRGLAKNISAALLGIQIDAIYHTSIVMQGLEYVYDGGIKTLDPGSTHLGQPIQIIELGTTDLPIDVIMEYLDSLKQIYTPEVCLGPIGITVVADSSNTQAYDLWSHNCNNFSNDFATFLLGKGIPEHITSLPQTVLDTPFGRMIRPQINDMVQNRKAENGGLLGIERPVSTSLTHRKLGVSVRRPTTMQELDGLLANARTSCAVVFFTSPTCKPSAKLHSLYNELASETAHRALFITVDISKAYDISTKYGIQATPTFITFIQGNQQNQWTGPDPSTLRKNVRMLIQTAWPPHQHESLRLPALRRSSTTPVLYRNLPPLEKLRTKMGPLAEGAAVAGIMHFISTRATAGVAESTLPDLHSFSQFLLSAPSKLLPEVMFTVVDLFRAALLDPRFSGYYAEEKDHKTIAHLLSYVNSFTDCPYSLRLVALQAVCNLFSSPLYPQSISDSPKLASPVVQLIATSLLDEKHPSVRVAAASLSFNIAVANSRLRLDEHRDALLEGDQIELAASLLEAIAVEEESPEALQGLLLAFGYLVYCTPENGELMDLLRAMDAQGTVLAKRKLFPDEALVEEVAEELLGTGLR